VRVFSQRLKSNIGTTQALTLIAAVILGLGVAVQESHAGFCESASGCCSSSEDCGQYDRCIFKSGACFDTGFQTYCNDDSECGEPDSCIDIGYCVGGDSDGEVCSEELGMCSDFSGLCNYDGDCGSGSCLFGDMCPGGICQLCGGGCYISTATFGTDLEGKTVALKSFRDNYLQKCAVGRELVKAYYRYSPPIAEYISDRHWLRSLVRILLLPIIGLVSLFV